MRLFGKSALLGFAVRNRHVLVDFLKDEVGVLGTGA
jgi:hypothetical protein